MLVTNVDWLSHARKIYAQLKINFTDVFQDPTITVIAGDCANICLPEQAVNGRESMSHKWASTDGIATTDGTYYTCPDTVETAQFNEFGWWSGTLSSGTKTVSLTAPLIIEYSQRGVGSYLLAFDDKRNEYATDFNVKFYSLGSLIYTSTVTGNTQNNILVTIPFQDDIDEVRLDITKWSHANTFCKVAEFTTQVTKIYDLSDIVDFNIIEQREVSTDNSIPQGNISSSELDFSILNIDGEFDYNNTDSRLHGLIKNNARVTLEIGSEYLGSVEYVPLFSGFTSGWSIPENSMSATAHARDRLDVMRQTKITNSTVELNKTFLYLFKWVLNNHGLADYEFNIDTTLDGVDYIVPVSWFEAITHKEGLELLAKASSSVVYQDRLGIIQVKPLVAFSGTSVETFTRDHYSNKDNQPIFDDIANIVRVTTSPLQLSTGVTLYETADDEPFSIGASTTTTETLFYQEAPTINQNVVVSPAVSGVTVISQTHYVWGSTVTVENLNATAKDFYLVSTGDLYEVKGQQVVTKRDQPSIDENGEQELIWEATPLLQTKTMATIIATNILSSFKDPQKDVQLTLSNSGNPAVELGDKTTVTDKYASIEYNITETEINFNGGLSINHKGRK